MPIDENGIIIPKARIKTRKDKTKNLLKGIPYIAILGLICTVVALYIQKNSLELQNEEVKKEIEKLNIELKEGYTQFKTAYISCDATEISISQLCEDNYEVVNNEILELIFDKEIGLQKQLGYDDSIGIDPVIVFLSLESFGARKLTDMKVFLKKIIYKEDSYPFYNHFSEINYDDENIVSVTEMEIGLGDRFAGENILVPVFLRYELYNDIKRKEEERDELIERGDFVISYFPDDCYIYKCIYVPVKVTYYDNIADENIEVEIRDMLDYHLKISEFADGLG